MEHSVIVVGVDLSPESEAAARQALEACRRGGHDLVLLHAGGVVEVPPVSDSPSPVVREAVETYRAQLARALAGIRERLGDLRERLSDQGVTVSQVLHEDAPADALCAVATEMDARLVVVGAHGGGGMLPFSLGSVAAEVVRGCDRDVLVARPSRIGRNEFRTIAVGTDFSASAERALDVALQLAAEGAEVEVVHCAAMRPIIQGGFGLIEPLPAEVRQTLVDDLRAQGEQLVKRKQRAGVSLSFHVSSDRPVAGLAHWAEARSCDLVAVGSHGRRGIRRLLLGSVAEAILKRAPCSVLVTHKAPPPG